MRKGTGLLQGLHGALMPDYNRAAAIYWSVLAGVGGGARHQRGRF